jgi:hypothetical protein
MYSRYFNKSLTLGVGIKIDFNYLQKDYFFSSNTFM